MMKKQEKIWVTSVIAALLLICVGFSQSSAEADTAVIDVPEDVIEAVRSSPSVQAEISRVRKHIKSKESTNEDIKIIGLGGGCGVAGCGASYLAVITVHRRGTNPQSASVLATVHRSPKGVLGRVSIVELKAKGQEETKLEIQRKYSSPLPIIERK